MKENKKESVFRRLGNNILQLQRHIKDTNKGTWILYLVLRGIVILCGIRALFIGNYEYVMLCILVLGLFLMPSFIERKLNIDFPSALEKIILLFAFAAEILGEIGEFYVLIPWWDTMLHTLNGFLCAAIGLALVDILNEKKQIKFEVSPIFSVIVAISFSMTIGVLWEFFEFGVDNILKFDMQKDTVLPAITSTLLNPDGRIAPVHITDITETMVNGQSLGVSGYLDIGLYDTMEDLLVNFAGAIVFSFFGYKYVASKGKNSFASQFVPLSNDWKESEAAIASKQESASEQMSENAEGSEKTEEIKEPKGDIQYDNG